MLMDGPPDFFQHQPPFGHQPPFWHHVAPVAPSGTDWAAITAIGTCVIAAGVLIALISFVEERRRSHARTAAEFSQRWLAPDMVAARKEIRNYADTEKLRDAVIKADRFGLDDYYVFMAELNFFEEMGALQQRHGITLGWVRTLIGDVTIDRWRMWKPTVEAIREKRNHPNHYACFERLAVKLNRERLWRIWKRSWWSRWSAKP